MSLLPLPPVFFTVPALMNTHDVLLQVLLSLTKPSAWKSNTPLLASVELPFTSTYAPDVCRLIAPAFSRCRLFHSWCDEAPVRFNAPPAAMASVPGPEIVVPAPQLNVCAAGTVNTPGMAKLL